MKRPKKGPGSVDKGVQQLQSLFYKEVLYIYKSKSIKSIDKNKSLIYNIRDESLNEFESYQYDNIKSLSTGQNCYKKELDHSVDARTLSYRLLARYRQMSCNIILLAEE